MQQRIKKILENVERKCKHAAKNQGNWGKCSKYSKKLRNCPKSRKMQPRKNPGIYGKCRL